MPAPRPPLAPNPPPLAPLRAVDALGGSVIGLFRTVGDAVFQLANALSGLRDVFGDGGYYLRRTIVQQVYFTAVQAFWLVNLIGLALGVLVILPLLGFGITDVEVQARVIELSLFHQLVPLLTALVVIGRSGTAVTAEMGDINQCGGIDSLLAMGVEPHRFLVLPRIVGMTASLALLTLWGNIAAVAGAGAYNALHGHASFDNFAGACAATVGAADALFTALMVLCFGVAIALVQCHFGLRSRSSTEVQRNLPRAFVASLLCVIGLTVLFVLLRP